MTLLEGFFRVNRRVPCPVCAKPDWCLISREGGDTPVAAICSRVKNSNRWGEAGWMHLLRESWKPSRQRTRTVAIGIREMTGLAADYVERADPAALAVLSADLGVTQSSLRCLGIGWNGWAWSFPMKTATGSVCGIRLRRRDGSKVAERGSREGLFIPKDHASGANLFLAEGPTDTAALLDLGFRAIGRPSCRGGKRHLLELVRRQHPEQIVVVPDGDEPGRSGGRDIAIALAVVCPSVKVVVPPDNAKDVRAWRQAGGTKEQFSDLVERASVLRLGVRSIVGGGFRGS